MRGLLRRGTAESGPLRNGTEKTGPLNAGTVEEETSELELLNTGDCCAAELSFFGYGAKGLVGPACTLEGGISLICLIWK